MTDSRSDDSIKIEQQKKEDARRQWEKQLFQNAEECLKERFALKRANEGQDFSFGIPEPLPANPEPVGADIAAMYVKPDTIPVKGDLPAYGVYPVYLTENNNKVLQDYKISYSAKGVKPNPPSIEGWSAAMDFIIKHQLCTTIQVTVAREPHFPKNEADFLLSCVQMCIDKGVEAKLSDDAKYFLSNLVIDKNNPESVTQETVDAILQGVELSRYGKFSETVAAAADTAHSWVVADTNKLEKQGKESSKNIERQIEGLSPPEDDDEFHLKQVNILFEELDTNVDQLQVILKHLADDKAAEEAIIEKPELSAKADKMKAPDDMKGKEQKDIADSIIQKMNAPTTTPTNAEVESRRELINTLNSPTIQKRKEKLLEALLVETNRATDLRNKISDAIKNNDPQIQARQQELRKRLVKFDEVLGPKNKPDVGKFAKEHQVLVDWNSKDRQAAVENKKAPTIKIS